jgi:hypothetical protein
MVTYKGVNGVNKKYSIKKLTYLDRYSLQCNLIVKYKTVFFNIFSKMVANVYKKHNPKGHYHNKNIHLLLRDQEIFRTIPNI